MGQRNLGDADLQQHSLGRPDATQSGWGNEGFRQRHWADTERLVGRIAQEVLVSSRQAVAQGDRLSSIAESLEQAVLGFKVDEVVAPLPSRRDRKLLSEASMKAR